MAVVSSVGGGIERKSIRSIFWRELNRQQPETILTTPSGGIFLFATNGVGCP